jgi:hypothetical protein
MMRCKAAANPTGLPGLFLHFPFRLPRGRLGCRSAALGQLDHRLNAPDMDIPLRKRDLDSRLAKRGIDLQVECIPREHPVVKILHVSA